MTYNFNVPIKTYFFKKEVHVIVCWVKANSNVDGCNKTFGKNTASIFKAEAVYASEAVLTTFFIAHLKRCK